MDSPLTNSAFKDGFELLSKPNVRKIFIAYLVTYLGTAMAPIALAFGMLELTGSTKDTAIVMAATAISTILVLFVGGVVSDRASRKHILVLSDLVAMATQLAVAVMFISGHASVPIATFLMLINGSAMALNAPATTGFIPEIVEQDELQKTNALLGLARNGAMVGGAALGGILVALFGAGITLVIDALTFAVSAIFIWSLVPKIKAEKPVAASMLQDLKLGWKEFSSHKWLWVIVLQFAFVVSAMQAVFAVIGPAVMNEFFSGSDAWGLVMSCLAIGLFIGGLIGFKINVRYPLRLATICVLFDVLIPLSLAAPLPLYLIALCAVISGIATEIFVVMWVSTLQKKVPANMLSRVSAYDYIGSISLAPIGILGAGFLYELLGYQSVLLGLTLIILIPTVLTLMVRDVRKLEF